jgi:hypothetical protein
MPVGEAVKSTAKGTTDLEKLTNYAPKKNGVKFT